MSDDIKKLFASRLRHYSSLAELSQVDVSRRLQLSTSTVNDWYTAEKMPRMNRIQELADLFGVEVSDLVDPSKPIRSRSRMYLLDKIRNASEEDLEKLKKLSDLVFGEDEEI